MMFNAQIPNAGAEDGDSRVDHASQGASSKYKAEQGNGGGCGGSVASNSEDENEEEEDGDDDDDEYEPKKTRKSKKHEHFLFPANLTNLIAITILCRRFQ